jgi:hypothetical protein
MKTAKDIFLEATSNETKTVTYKIKKTGLLKKDEKLDFVIKPITPRELLTENAREEIMKEIANGQNKEEACRVMAERLRNELMKKSDETVCKEMLFIGVVKPKLVDKEENLKEDELPYSLLKPYWDIKVFLMKHILEISPIFQGN